MANIETIQIHLHSKDANSYNNNSFSDCNFYLPVMELPLQHTIMLSVQSVIIPYTFYNINDSNNTLNYTQNNISSQVIISKGNYNAINLATFLTASMPNFTVKYNPIINKFSFTNNSNDFSFSTSSTCFTILGITNSLLSSTGKIYISTNCVNLLSNMCICIQSNLPTGNINTSKLSEGNVLCSFPVETPPYSLITYKNTNSFKTNLYSNTISYINIRIADHTNNLIDLNGCHFSMTLQIDVVDFVN
jgi:hypothetical protein